MSAEVPNAASIPAAGAAGQPTAKEKVSAKNQFLAIDTKNPKETAAREVRLAKSEIAIKVVSYAMGACLGVCTAAAVGALAISPVGWAIASAALFIAVVGLLVDRYKAGGDDIDIMIAKSFAYAFTGFATALAGGMIAGAVATKAGAYVGFSLPSTLFGALGTPTAAKDIYDNVKSLQKKTN